MGSTAAQVRIDFAARIATLRGVLERESLDAAGVMAPANIAYLSGFQALLYSRPIYLVVDAARTELVVPGLEEEHATHAKGMTTGNLSPAIIRMRLTKDEGEIALMRQAAALARIGVMATLEVAAPGQSQLAIESIGTNAILEAAPELTPEATINLLQFTTSGPETSLPHLITTTRRLNRPDLAIHSRQVSVDGERAELERTFAIGGMDAQTRRIFDVAEEAQLAAIAACRPGVPMREVDAAARSIIQAAGYGEHSIHRTGHGLGIEPHEAPYIRWDVEEPLEIGMVVSIEPGIYLPGVCGARHSDTVVITASGHETITEAPRGAENLIFDR